MPLLYITEYANLARDGAGHLMAAPDEPGVANQVVDFTGGVTLSTQFNSATHFVRLHADTKCNVAFGDSGVIAAASDTPVSAEAPEYFGVNGKAQYLSAVTF